MDKPNIVAIKHMKEHIGERITFEGWLTTMRRSGKIAFLQIRDGSGFVQAIAAKQDIGEEAFEAIKRLSQESSIRIVGEVRADDRSKLGVELGVDSLELVSEPSDAYPITPKEHGVDFLFEHRHLYMRHRVPWACMRVRDCVQRSIQDFFHERGFIRFDSPIFTPNAAEGTTDLFEVSLFDEDSAYLAQTGQLYAEVGALAYGKVYTFGPTFRAEKSKTRRHLLEFWMLEPEVAYLDHEGNMQLQEDMLSYIVGRTLQECKFELEMLERDTSKLEPTASGNFPRLTYDEAIAILNEKGEPLEWGEDFGAPHETLLGAQYDRPIFIEAWPTNIKAFYMQPYENDPTRVKCSDLIASDGYGELIGGSERIHDYALLKQRIEEHNLPMDAFEWYLDLRRYGSVPHSGFGMGLERTVAWITGVNHLREVIPFPRMLTRMYP